ncbi:MAG TPA: hypothetical protein VF844_00970 [Ktedonobacteraceae bacterium]
MAKYKDKVNEAAWSLSKSVREANQAVADSAVAAQELNMKFAQSIFENGVELLKSHAENTRAMMEEFVGEPEKDQAIFQTVADSAVAAQERNVKFAQSLLENGTEVLKSHAESTRALMQTLTEHSQKQQEAFQALTREAMNTYMGFFSAPFSFYEQTMETAESIAWQGVETAQKITHQGMEAAQKATRQEKQAVHSTTK